MKKFILLVCLAFTFSVYSANAGALDDDVGTELVKAFDCDTDANAVFSVNVITSDLAVVNSYLYKMQRDITVIPLNRKKRVINEQVYDTYKYPDIVIKLGKQSNDTISLKNKMFATSGGMPFRK